jgi:hypothetical protein
LTSTGTSSSLEESLVHELRANADAAAGSSNEARDLAALLTAARCGQQVDKLHAAPSAHHTVGLRT